MNKKIKHRAVYGFPSVPAHKSISNTSSRIEKVLKRNIENLQRQGIDISLYPQYLDSIVDTYIVSQNNILEQNHKQNVRHIEYTFQRRKSDKAECKRMVDLIDEEIVKTEEDLNFVELLYSKFNPLYQGKYTNKGVLEQDEPEEEQSE